MGGPARPRPRDRAKGAHPSGKQSSHQEPAHHLTEGSSPRCSLLGHTGILDISFILGDRHPLPRCCMSPRLREVKWLSGDTQLETGLPHRQGAHALNSSDSIFQVFFQRAWAINIRL